MSKIMKSMNGITNKHSVKKLYLYDGKKMTGGHKCKTGNVESDDVVIALEEDCELFVDHMEECVKFMKSSAEQFGLLRVKLFGHTNLEAIAFVPIYETIRDEDIVEKNMAIYFDIGDESSKVITKLITCFSYPPEIITKVKNQLKEYKKIKYAIYIYPIDEDSQVDTKHFVELTKYLEKNGPTNLLRINALNDCIVMQYDGIKQRNDIVVEPTIFFYESENDFAEDCSTLTDERAVKCNGMSGKINHLKSSFDFDETKINLLKNLMKQFKQLKDGPIISSVTVDQLNIAQPENGKTKFIIGKYYYLQEFSLIGELKSYNDETKMCDFDVPDGEKNITRSTTEENIIELKGGDLTVQTIIELNKTNMRIGIAK